MINVVLKGGIMGGYAVIPWLRKRGRNAKYDRGIIPLYRLPVW